MSKEVFQVVVPGDVVDFLQDKLAEYHFSARVFYGMAVMLGKTDFTIAEAVAELRSYEAEGIWSPEAAVIESAFTREEVHEACVAIYYSESYAEYRSKELAEQKGKDIAWKPEEETEEGKSYCHDIQDKAIVGSVPEVTGVVTAQTVVPVGNGWYFPGRIAHYNFITNSELTSDEFNALYQYVYEHHLGTELPF